MLLQLTLPSTVDNAPMLVAYSGGADSRLLLYLAKAYGETHGVSVYAAHMHHGIRGEEADRDLAFCRRTCAEWHIPLFEKQVDIPALSSLSGQSPETEAREQRYVFFREVMEANKIPLLLTAHHADDQLETLLLRFLRGTGTRGLGGIPITRPLSYGTAVRPLLSLTKAEILSACQSLGLDYVTDSTNELPIATRNRLRMEIIPGLEEIAGAGVPQQAAERLARAAREDNECLDALATAELMKCKTENGLSVSEINQRHPAIVKRILSAAYTEAATLAYGTPPDSRHTLTAVHLEALVTLCRKETGGASLDLPLMSADLRKGVLSFLPPREFITFAPETPMPLTMGDTSWDHGRLIIRIEAVTPPEILSLNDDIIASALFPPQVLPLSARVRAEGDVIFSHGMHKKLKKLLCDKGVPPHLRDRMPLLCYGNEHIPLWYPTVAFADGFPPPTHGTAIRITLIRA